MTPDELLDTVVDRDSFVAFVETLAEERERAYQMERDDPARYGWGGALGWEYGDISSFPYSALAYFEPGVYHHSRKNRRVGECSRSSFTSAKSTSKTTGRKFSRKGR